MKEITLKVHGREINFFEDRLIVILEKYFENEAMECLSEEKWFKVNPQSIDQTIFNQPKSDSKQEKMRKYILEAFEEMKKNPKYTRPFKTQIPKKTWSERTLGELKELASTGGDHIANWVEQALEWAQRISNGESWVNICNNYEPIESFERIVLIKERAIWGVGGPQLSSSHVCYYSFAGEDSVDKLIVKGVPVIVAYDD